MKNSEGWRLDEAEEKQQKSNKFFIKRLNDESAQ